MKRLVLLTLVSILPALAAVTIIAPSSAIAQSGSCSLGPETALTGTWSSDDVAGIFTLAQSGERVSGTLDVQGTVYKISGACASPMHVILNIPRPMDRSYSGCQGFDQLKDSPWLLTLTEGADGSELNGKLGQTAVDSNGLTCVVTWKTRDVILKRQTEKH